MLDVAELSLVLNGAFDFFKSKLYDLGGTAVYKSALVPVPSQFGGFYRNVPQQQHRVCCVLICPIQINQELC